MSDKVPNGWKECKLGRVIELLYGKGLREQDRKPGNIPVYGSNGIVGYHNEYLVKGPGIIIGRKGSVGEVKYSPVDFFPIDTTYYVDIKEEVADIRFMYYFLLTLHIDEMNSHSAVPGLNRNDLYSLDITMPPLPEQRAIASVLSSLDDKIDLLHRENKMLEAMAETLFRQWFIEENNTNEMIAVSNIASIESNNIKPAQKPRDLFYHYSISAFDKGQIPAIEFGETILSNKFIVLPNTVLVSKLNPSTPRIWLIDDSVKQNSVCSTEFQILKPKEIQYIFFLYFLMKSDEVVSEFAMSATGTSGSHQRIRPEYILEIEAPIPEKSKLDAFNNICGPIMKRVKKNQQQTITLEKLRDTLLPKLMSGEVRVKYEEEEMASCRA